MANRYEFNIEDINLVLVVVKKDKLSTTYKRVIDMDTSYPLEKFIQTFYATPEVVEGTRDTVKVICPRCGKWNIIDTSITETNYTDICDNCDIDYEDIVNEEYIINLLKEIMSDEETFFETDIFINDIHIL